MRAEQHGRLHETEQQDSPSPSFWPAGSNEILGEDVIFRSRWYPMNRVPRAAIVRPSRRRISDTIVLRVGVEGGSSPETHYL